MEEVYQIGVISDTHGLLRPEAVECLRDSDLILHAGDIGSSIVMEELSRIAPVVGVRGNCDRDPWAYSYDLEELVEVNGTFVYLLHDLVGLTIDPGAADVKVVVAGHTHEPSREIKNSVLYFNPGSAGPKRYNKPVSLGKIILKNNQIETQWVEVKNSID